MENDTATATETPITEKPKRKRYGILPEDSPRNKAGKKMKPKVLIAQVLINMTPTDRYNLIKSAEKAGFPSYSSYIRFLADKVITEDSLIVTLAKKTMRNLQDNAEAMGKSVDDYVRYLANLKVSVS